MSQHRFIIGQNVRFTRGQPRGSAESYEIVRLMPHEGKSFAYQIKSDSEKFSRVAQEYELRDEASLVWDE